MTQAQAQLELIKLNKTIEAKIVQHKNELAKLWWRKGILQNIANQ